jgi:hypothetical protein
MYASLLGMEDLTAWFVAFSVGSGVLHDMCVCSMLCVHCMHARTAVVGNTATNYQTAMQAWVCADAMM